MPIAPKTSQSPPVGVVALLVITGVLYVGMMGSLSDSHCCDAAGRALTSASGAFFGILLWAALGILLVVGAITGAMPRWAAIAAAILYPASAAAAFTAVQLYERDPGWTLAIPALLPPLIAVYAMSARIPALHRVLPPGKTSGVMLGAIIAVTVAAFVEGHLDRLAEPARHAEAAAQYEAMKDRERQEAQQREQRATSQFDALNPDSSLRDYLEYLSAGDVRYRPALAGARQVKSRQSDAVALLKEGKLSRLPALSELDLEATPVLCEAFADALSRAASRIDPSTTDYRSAALDAETELANVEWLIARHCDLADPLADLETRVRAISDSSRMDQFAATLARLRQTH